jgi:endonuclease-3
MTPANKKKLLAIFAKLYRNPESELNFQNQYQLLISVMLSAQSTDKKVNEITPALFQMYPGFTTLQFAKLSDVEERIRQVNYYKTKSRHLIATAQKVCKDFKGRVPRTHEKLTSLPGVGNKTANVILSELGITPAFPVDTHVFRVSKRLGLASANTRDKVEEQLKTTFEPEIWRSLHHWLIFHGRRVCKASNPLCGECPFSALCPSASAATAPKRRKIPSST